MTGFIEDDFLEFEGVTAADVAALNAALPDLEHLVGVLQQNWPMIAKIAPVLLRVAQEVLAKQRGLKS